MSLYDDLGGIYGIAAVVDRFSDRLFTNPVVGIESPNMRLRDWHRNNSDGGRLPGLKWLRTLWVANVAGGPYEYLGTKPGAEALGLENAHRDLRITPDEFDAVAGELAATLEEFNIPEDLREAVLGAFAAHRDEVTEGTRTTGTAPM